MNNTNVDKQALHVNHENDDFTIERSPHDASHSFSIISNELIRDISISPECRLLIIFLLSNRQGWQIKFNQVMLHFSNFMGRDKVYKLFNEAMEAGYLKRIESTRGNKEGGRLKTYKYFVSERPTFKKFHRCPENQDTGDQYTGNTDTKEILSSKNTIDKNTINTSLKVPEEPAAGAAMPAKAGEVDLPPPTEIPKKKPASEFPAKVRDLGNTMINSMIEVNPEYRPAKQVTPLLTSLDLMLRIDRRAPEKIIEVFLWAIHDPFWADKLFRPNPAAYLRDKFDQFCVKMTAKPAANPNQPDRRLKDKEGKAVDAYKDLMF